MQDYDIIVIGAGHAGSEAAAAAANMGSKVLLITMDLGKIAQMSCNPAMGGIAKGQIVREIDAMGGYSGLVTDDTMIQFRMLNRSKGPAMWSPRAQSDRMRFSDKWRRMLEETEGVNFWQDTVTGIIIERNIVKGVKTRLGVEFRAKAVILTSGTFLNGLMHVGKNQIEGGRMGDEASLELSDGLEKYGFRMGRMKTGTPVRIDGRTVDFGRLIEQKGDEEGGYFSYLNYDKKQGPQRSCFIAHTSPVVHKELELGLSESPLFDGTISSIGPRYCPSIEDKLKTFSDKNSHQLFLEPEGEEGIEYYLNGFSSSLPLMVQYEGLKKMKGFENVEIFRPGYAIEYDYFDPTQLYHTLETKMVKNLYFAGQVNGTTGYEEAGAQGMMAGINANLKIRGKNEFVLKRDEAYIGVLIDDLVTKGVDEPYRMFTARAEYRILLRQDNADERLTEKAYNIGLARKERFELCRNKYAIRDELVEKLRKFSVKPDIINQLLENLGSSRIKQSVKVSEIIKRPEVNIEMILDLYEELDSIVIKAGKLRKEIIESAEIVIKYSGYIEREQLVAKKIARLEAVKIPANIDYDSLKSISIEGRQKLKKINPKTIGQASRIIGVSPADVSVLLVYLGR